MRTRHTIRKLTFEHLLLFLLFYKVKIEYKEAEVFLERLHCFDIEKTLDNKKKEREVVSFVQQCLLIHGISSFLIKEKLRMGNVDPNF